MGDTKPRSALPSLVAALGVLLVAWPQRGEAQLESQSALLTLAGGPTNYSLQGEHRAGLIALRLASPLVPLGTDHWWIEPSWSYESFRSDSGQLRHVFVSEVQIQAHTSTPRAQPYAGVGGGFTLSAGTPTHSGAHPIVAHLTFSAGAGLRVAVAESWGVVGDFRVRRLTLFRGWSSELTAGVFAAF
jgi:hypothetical protein